MTTKADLVLRTAQMLGRKRLGQSITADLEIRIEAAYSEVYEDLKDDQIVTWGKESVIPDKMTPHLSALMALNCADAGVSTSSERYNRIVAKFVEAKKNIRRLSTPKYESMDEPRNF